MRLVSADKHRCEGLWTRVQEERRRGVGGGWGYGLWMEFPGYQRQHETASMFWPWNLISKGSNTILWKFQELSFALPGICSTKVKKFQGFFKKVYPQHIAPPPMFVFFWNSPIMVKLKNMPPTSTDWKSSRIKCDLLSHLRMVSQDISRRFYSGSGAKRNVAS